METLCNVAFVGINRTNDPQWVLSGGEPPKGEAQAAFINRRTGEEVGPSAGYGAIIDSYPIASGEDFEAGDLVRLDGSSNLGELTAVTQTVLGVALEPVVSGVSLGVITNRAMVERASRADNNSLTHKTRFHVTDVNSVTPVAATHVGVQCVIDLTSGEWTIDVSDTANTDVEIVAVDTLRVRYLVEFLDAVIQTPS